MSVFLQREMDKLRRQILTLSGEVEKEVRIAVRAVMEKDDGTANEVIARESGIDMLEVDIEEECLKILALHQPVAVDLRYIVTVLKINSDLERISDLATHIAESSMVLSANSRISVPAVLDTMSNQVQMMLKTVLDSFVDLDDEIAMAVCASDRQIDDMHRNINDLMLRKMAETPAMIPEFIHVMHIARHLERIGDHIKNIGEDVIYLIDGKIIRHKTAFFAAK